MKARFVLLVLVAGLAACEDESERRPRFDGGIADGGTDVQGADAAVPAIINLGPGYNATVTVDPAGTGHIAWIGNEPDVTTLHFCLLPRGAQQCTVRTTIATSGTSLSRPFVVVKGATVQVLSYRYGLVGDDFSAVFLFTSQDSGLTFGPGKKVGKTPFSAATLGPGDAVSVTTHAYSNGLAYQRLPLGDEAVPENEALLSTTHLYSGAVALDGATPVVVFATAEGQAQTRRYSGAGDINSEASWSAAVDIGESDRMHLAASAAGLFMLAQVGSAFVVRRYESGNFDTGVSLPEGTGEFAQAHLTTDLAGQLHVAWPRIDAQGIRLDQAVSVDGRVWQQRTLIRDEGIGGVRLSAAADHGGFAVWETAASAPLASVHVLPLLP